MQKFTQIQLQRFKFASSTTTSKYADVISTKAVKRSRIRLLGNCVWQAIPFWNDWIRKNDSGLICLDIPS